MDCSVKLSKNDEGKAIDVTFYKNLIESLRSLTHTRLDILYGVGLVSRFIEKPKSTHWKTTKGILH